MQSNGWFIWFPVALLPVSNLVVAGITHEPLAVSLAWILGAVFEELLFRVFLLRQIVFRVMKPVPAIIIVSFLFAGIHLFNLRGGQPPMFILLQGLAAFCFSIWAGIVTWKSTWLIPILAHVLLNATAGDGSVWWIAVLMSAVVLVDGLALLKSYDM